MRKTYRFSLDTKLDKDIFGILESIPKPLRGQFIIIALRQFQGNLPEYLRSFTGPTTPKSPANFTKSFEDDGG